MSDENHADAPRTMAAAPADAGPTVEVHYIKSNYFRVIQVDGAWGGLGPRGLMQVAVYNERRPIPEKIIAEFGPNKALLVKESIGKEGIVREVEAELIMTLEVAEALADWLSTRITAAKEMLSQPREHHNGA